MSSPATPPAWLPADLFPFEHRYVELDGHLVHYVDEGRGPTLLLLHGNPTWSFLYRKLIPLLRDRFRCVALDWPGFGLSTAAPGYDFRPQSHARVLEAFLDRLELRGWSPFVQDWGGPIGLWVAGRRPQDVRRLLIGNTMAWPVDADPHFRRFSGLMGGPVGRFAIRHANAFVNLMIPVGTPRSSLSHEEMAAYRGPTATWEGRLPTWVFPREIVGSTSFLAEVEAGLAHLADKPALILWGDKDVAFRAQERLRFEQIFSQHQVAPLPGAGHYIQEDAPEEIAAAIRAWWA